MNRLIPVALAIAIAAWGSASSAQSAAPPSRLTEAQVRALEMQAFEGGPGGDGVTAFERALTNALPGYQGVPLDAFRSDALSITVVGPVAAFDRDVSDAVRRGAPIGGAQWTPGVTVVVSPAQIDSPDIVRIVLTRAGMAVTPTNSSLIRHELPTGPGTTVVLHIGHVLYSTETFDPGASVVLTAIPQSGQDIVRVFTDQELRRIQ